MAAIDQYKTMTSDQLGDQLLQLKKEQFNLRFQQATGQIEKTHRFDEVRKSIARVKTLQQRHKPAAAQG